MAREAQKREDAPPADSFERLIRELEKLPGVGRRSAERMAYYVLGASRDDAMALAYAIRDVKKNLHPCAVCGDLTEGTQCAICGDARRDGGLVCVVEWPRDVRAIEKSGQFFGRYHVLMGRISPLSGVEPEDLRIPALLQRVRQESVRELVMATSPTVEGDATASYIAQQLKLEKLPATVTRLARGVPQGSDLSFAQSSTIGEALKGRTVVGDAGNRESAVGNR
ncbi:MAG TPA: recombination mediator RecR [Planctomycetota bacterium]|nr:recombination mediator RecR [Planctomycetota bacterium]